MEAMRTVSSRHTANMTIFALLICLCASLASATPLPKDQWPGVRTPMHTMWGAEDDQEDWSHQPPTGVKLTISQTEVKQAFGLENDDTDLAREIRHDASQLEAAGKKLVGAWLSDIEGVSAGTMNSQKLKTSSSKAAQQKHRIHKQYMAAANGETDHGDADKRGRKGGAQSLSHINQPEMGVNPEGQPCPDYGLDKTEYIVAGKTSHYWRKTVEIRDVDGEVLGTVKRGCPAWTNSFAWQVPKEHASGCRNGVDPSVFSDQCQIPETEILYTDQWTGMLQLAPTRVMDCHDDIIFKIYEVKKDVILSGYMIHSDFVVEDKDGKVMGYARLEGFQESAPSVGSHNFSFINLDGEEVARAERPIHWENGAEEHQWNVTITAPIVPMTLTDTRVVLVAVANSVMLSEETDWCSDLVWMLTPVIITLMVIGIIAGVSAVAGFYGSPNRGKLSLESPRKKEKDASA